MALTIKNLSINLGSKEVFIEESVGIADGSKVGLIGRNGVGKTTLLKAILGQIHYNGSIEFNGKAAYFSQDINLNREKTVRETINESTEIHHQNVFEKEIQQIEQQLSDPKTFQDHEKMTRLSEKYVELQSKLKNQNTTHSTNKLKSVLQLLEVKEEWLDQKIGNLSTGQRAIIALAQILSSHADLLLLDEPTNHLDFKRLDILEKYLQQFKGTVIMVTHDRYFLDQTCNAIIKIEHGKWTKYNSNYTGYLKIRKMSFEAQTKAYEVEQKYLADEKDKIARIGKGKAKVKQGKYREKQLAKKEFMEKPDLDQSKFKATIESTPINASIVLELINLTVGYEKPLIENINLAIGNKERYVLIGENGIGKSSLFKTIEGRLKPLAGKVILNVQTKLGYMDQELKDLTIHQTLYDEIFALTKDIAKTRQQLSIGGFVSEEEVYKPIALLSLGEKSRLNLIKILIKKPNLLLLDEPTNHLDIDAREIIENAFMNYQGAILAVSHDRYFIKKIAQRIIKIENKKLFEVKK